MKQQSGAGGSTWLVNAVKQNPEGLLLLAAGAVLLMRKTGSSHSMSSVYSQPRTGYPQPSGTPYGGSVQDAASGYAEQAKEAASRYAQEAKEAVKSYATSASQYAEETGRAVGAQSERIVRSAQSTVQSTVNRILQDQPLLIAAAGLAAGAAVAAAFPATAMERQTLGPIGDQISGAAGRMGEQLQQATAKAGEKLKSAVDERGLNADGLKEVAKEVASAFSEGMSGKPEQKPESGLDTPFQQSQFDRNR